MEHKIFLQYAQEVGPARQLLADRLQQPDVCSYFESLGQSSLLAVRLELPILLLEPLYHFRHYVETLEVSQASRWEGTDLVAETWT